MLRIYCLQQWYNLSDPGAACSAGCRGRPPWIDAVRKSIRVSSSRLQPHYEDVALETLIEPELLIAASQLR